MNSLPVLLMLGAMPCVLGAVSSGDKPSSDRDQVLKVVQGFFDALAANNSGLLRQLYYPGGQVTSLRPGDHGLTVRRRSVEEDVQWLATNKEKLLERGWNPTVHVEGRIAVVWVPYDFHRNGKFSHNGTDVFTLMKFDEGWRIVCTAYTVEPEPPSKNPAGAPG